MRTQMKVIVKTITSKGIETLEIPLNDVEIEIDEKKIKLGKYIEVNEKEKEEYRKAIVKLDHKYEKTLFELAKNDAEWKNQTNDVLKGIIKKQKEMEGVM